MPQVNIPSVGVVNFPDSMSQDDISAAIQKNYPQLTTPTTTHPDDSGFLSGIKQLGNSAARVGIKAVTGLPLMAADAATGIGNLVTKGNLGNKADYPGAIYDQNLDSTFAPPTTTAGKWSEGLSTILASLGLPGPNGVKQAGDLAFPRQSLTGADAIKAEAMKTARDNGIVVPPSLTKNPPTGANLANGYGGTAETLKAARVPNTDAVNGVVAKDLGLDAGSPLTVGAKGTVTGQITDAVKAGYDPIRDIGQIPVDGAHRAFVANLTKADRGASNISPALGNPKIAELSDALIPKASKVDGGTGVQSAPSYDSGDLVDAISALRAKASDAFSTGDSTLGKAYKQAANGYESLIDRFLQKQAETDPDAASKLTNFRLARTRIAKGNDTIDALNTATGDVDPRILAANDTGQLTGGMKDVSQVARAFPYAVVPSKGSPPGVTAFQGNMAPEAIAAGPGGVAATVSGMLGRNAARNYALSKRAQEALMQPKGATLTSKALNAVFSNPAAFGAMYEEGASAPPAPQR